MTARLYLTDDLYVEQAEEHAVVSWPGGHRTISYEADVVELLTLVGTAFQDILHQRDDDTTSAYNEGYDTGWEEASKAKEEPPASA